jgi:hypothetical protein
MFDDAKEALVIRSHNLKKGQTILSLPTYSLNN